MHPLCPFYLYFVPLSVSVFFGKIEGKRPCQQECAVFSSKLEPELELPFPIPRYPFELFKSCWFVKWCWKHWTVSLESLPHEGWAYWLISFTKITWAKQYNDIVSPVMEGVIILKHTASFHRKLPIHWFELILSQQYLTSFRLRFGKLRCSYTPVMGAEEKKNTLLLDDSRKKYFERAIMEIYFTNWSRRYF